MTKLQNLIALKRLKRKGALFLQYPYWKINYRKMYCITGLNDCAEDCYGFKITGKVEDLRCSLKSRFSLPYKGKDNK